MHLSCTEACPVLMELSARVFSCDEPKMDYRRCMELANETYTQDDQDWRLSLSMFVLPSIPRSNNLLFYPPRTYDWGTSMRESGVPAREGSVRRLSHIDSEVERRVMSWLAAAWQPSWPALLQPGCHFFSRRLRRGGVVQPCVKHKRTVREAVQHLQSQHVGVNSGLLQELLSTISWDLVDVW